MNDPRSLMSTVYDRPIPPEMLEGDTPLTDELWAEILAAAEREAEATGGRVEVVLAESVDHDPEDPDVPVRWRIRSDQDAAWAMSVVSNLELETRVIHDQATAWIQNIYRWAEAATKEQDRRAGYLRGHLLRWGRERREANPTGPATFPLPTGKVTTQSRAPVADIADMEALVAWVKAQLAAEKAAELIQVVEKVGTRDIRKMVQIRETVVESEVMLACGHVVTVEGEPPPTDGPWVVRCLTCEDADAGVIVTPMMVPVADVGYQRVSADVVWKDDMAGRLLEDPNPEGRAPGADPPPTLTPPAPIPGLRVTPGRMIVNVVSD